jgi:Family of unknown function (DUF6476)
MRALTILTVVMGVMILGGTLVLGLLIARRVSGAGQQPASFAVQLAEPEGTRIAAIAALQDRLALQLQGGGPDRVLFIDQRTGARVGRIELAPAVAPVTQ